MDDARDRFRRVVDKKGWSSSELGRQLGCSQSHAWRLLFSDAWPSLPLAFAIERVTDGAIKAREWADSDREAVR